jgi:hypothetical protein
MRRSQRSRVVQPVAHHQHPVACRRKRRHRRGLFGGQRARRQSVMPSRGQLLHRAFRIARDQYHRACPVRQAATAASAPGRSRSAKVKAWVAPSSDAGRWRSHAAADRPQSRPRGPAARGGLPEPFDAVARHFGQIGHLGGRRPASAAAASAAPGGATRRGPAQRRPQVPRARDRPGWWARACPGSACRSCRRRRCPPRPAVPARCHA